MENSKEKIANAFKSLLSEKPFEKITTKEIVRKSDLGRQTFYYHFNDKYDLMNWMYFQQAAPILKNFKNLQNWEIALKLFYDFMLENSEFYTNIININGQNSFYEYACEYGIKFYLDTIEYKYGKKEISTELIFSVTMFLHGSMYMCKQWLNDSIKMSSAELARQVYRNIPNELKKYTSK